MICHYDVDFDDLDGLDDKLKKYFVLFFYISSLLVKTRLRRDSETTVSIDDVISLDDSISLDNLSLSPTHYIEKAANVANVAMTYLPSSVEATVAKASQKVVDAQSKASETVYRTRERASSFLTTIRRSNTLTSREDIPRPPPQFDPDNDRLSIETRQVYLNTL